MLLQNETENFGDAVSKIGCTMLGDLNTNGYGRTPAKPRLCVASSGLNLYIQ